MDSRSRSPTRRRDSRDSRGTQMIDQQAEELERIQEESNGGNEEPEGNPGGPAEHGGLQEGDLEGEEEEPQGDDFDDGGMGMMEDPLGREEEDLDDPTTHPYYNVWPVSYFRRGKGRGKGRAAGQAPRFNAFGGLIPRYLSLPENLDVNNRELLAMYARNVWRTVNPGGEASSSGVERPIHMEEDQPSPTTVGGELPPETSNLPQEGQGEQPDEMMEAYTTNLTDLENEADEFQPPEGERDGFQDLLPEEEEEGEVPPGGDLHEGQEGDQVGGAPGPQGPPDEEPEGDPPLEGEEEDEPVPPYRVWVTPNGTRYHTSLACPTLAASRRLIESRWCPRCGRVDPARRYGNLCIPRPGEDAHVDLNCPLALGPWSPYPHCQRCSTT